MAKQPQRGEIIVFSGEASEEAKRSLIRKLIKLIAKTNVKVVEDPVETKAKETKIKGLSNNLFV